MNIFIVTSIINSFITIILCYQIFEDVLNVSN